MQKLRDAELLARFHLMTIKEQELQLRVFVYVTSGRQAAPAPPRSAQLRLIRDHIADQPQQ